MTFQTEFKDIFEKKIPPDEIYFRILKWLSKYKNIVKCQDTIQPIIKRIYIIDLNQESNEYVEVLRNPFITNPLKNFIQDFLYGDVYRVLRDEMMI